jgi:hypothetical protein
MQQKGSNTNETAKQTNNNPNQELFNRANAQIYKNLDNDKASWDTEYSTKKDIEASKTTKTVPGKGHDYMSHPGTVFQFFETIIRAQSLLHEGRPVGGRATEWNGYVEPLREQEAKKGEILIARKKYVYNGPIPEGTDHQHNSGPVLQKLTWMVTEPINEVLELGKNNNLQSAIMDTTGSRAIAVSQLPGLDRISTLLKDSRVPIMKGENPKQPSSAKKTLDIYMNEIQATTITALTGIHAMLGVVEHRVRRHTHTKNVPKDSEQPTPEESDRAIEAEIQESIAANGGNLLDKSEEHDQILQKKIDNEKQKNKYKK